MAAAEGKKSDEQPTSATEAALMSSTHCIPITSGLRSNSWLAYILKKILHNYCVFLPVFI